MEGFDSVNSVVQTPDGGYVLAGVIDTEKNPDQKVDRKSKARYLVGGLI